MIAWLAALILAIPLGLDLYMPVPEDNPITEEKIELGRRLFNDRRLSRDRSIACASCHDPKRAFSDGRPVAIGVYGRLGRRSAPALINRGYGRAFFWDGRAASLEEQVLQPIQDPNEMDMTPRRSVLVWVSVKPSLFDRFANGDRSALTAEQQPGCRCSGKGNCTACHVGPTFSDERFHNTGIAWRDGRLHEGRAAVTRSRRPRRVQDPTLREISRTPDMHDGVAPRDVVDHDRGGNRIPARRAGR